MSQSSLHYIVKLLVKGCFHANPLVRMRTTMLIAAVLQFDVMELNSGINYAAGHLTKCVPNMVGIDKVNDQSDRDCADGARR